MTVTSSRRPRIARIAVWTGAAGSEAALPRSSFEAGSPNSSTARTPSARAAAASSTASSTDSWQTPGIDDTSRRTPAPSHTNNG